MNLQFSWNKDGGSTAGIQRLIIYRMTITRKGDNEYLYSRFIFAFAFLASRWSDSHRNISSLKLVVDTREGEIEKIGKNETVVTNNSPLGNTYPLTIEEYLRYTSPRQGSQRWLISVNRVSPRGEARRTAYYGFAGVLIIAEASFRNDLCQRVLTRL